MKPYILLIVFIGLSGCSRDHFIYSRPNTTAAQFNKDHADCQLYAMNMPDKGTAVAATLAAHNDEFLQLIDRADRGNREAKVVRYCMQIKGYRAVKR